MFPSSNPGTEENKFKQRLVGALVLIALAVIIIPLIIDFRKDYDHVIKSTNIPPKPDDFRIEVVPLTPPEDANSLPTLKDSEDIVSESSPAGQEIPSTAAAEPSLSAKPREPVVQAEATPGAVKTDTSKTVAVAKPANETVRVDDRGWIVQLGSFSSKENAEDLRNQLQKKGYKAFVDEVAVGGKQIQRVRIGPMEKKPQAEAIRDKLAAEMKLDVIVVSDR